MRGNTTKGQHFGSQLYLTMKVICTSQQENVAEFVNPQDITRDNGKIYRLHADGRIPADNPFVGKTGAKAIYGHRNPQGLAKHPTTGAIWDQEHGPKGGDEINIIKGANYGWPL
jgi:glucose/arabinose dehydrogenase